MEWLHDLFKRSPEMALFLSLTLGYYIGKLKFGKFQLGGVAGSLLVAVVVSQVGVKIDDGVKAVLFALFIYAVGFESGPQFFSSLGKRSLKEIVLAAVMAVTGLATVIVTAKLCGLDKGIAAGVAAGGLTQSAIIGTAGDAIAKLGLAADETTRLQGNVAIGYAVTYVFGSFGAIIVCVNFLPKFMGRSIRDDAIAAETAMQAGAAALGPDQEAGAPALVGRIYELTTDLQRTVADIEYADPASTITIEKVKHDGKFIEVGPDLKLRRGDVVLVVGRRAAVVAACVQGRQELYDVDGMELAMQKREIVLTNKNFDHKTIGQIRRGDGRRRAPRRLRGPDQPHGQGACRCRADMVVQVGDMVSIFGAEQDVKRVAARIGEWVIGGQQQDRFRQPGRRPGGRPADRPRRACKLGGIPLTLGSGGGALLSGLLFGWWRARRQTWASCPLAAGAAAQGLRAGRLRGGRWASTSGLQAVTTIQ